MKSNINKTRRKLENHPETDTVTVDGNTSGAILRALVDDYDENFKDFVENDLEASIQSTQYVGFGTEVEVQ